MTTSLPIDGVLPELLLALDANPAAVLQAPPGAGKTTRVPIALLDASWLAGRSIVMLEPRRLAATNAARFMAAQLGEEVGATVGYAIRYERKVSSRTRIEVVTEGILTRRLQADPELAGVGLVIFDEFHERNLNADLALALCRDAQLGLRDDLKLLVMSATLDAAPVAQLLGGVPLVSSSGRAFPVAVRYQPQKTNVRLVEMVPPAVRAALNETQGDVLVFLPGAGEIRSCAEQLSGLHGIDVRPLYGGLPFAEQELAIVPGPRRKVVLATNIAETSLTIDGIGVVVDAGYERRPRFDAARGMSALALARISRASAEQRAGRAGRLGPGVCYRLWSEGDQGSLLPFAPPEMLGADLAPLALDLARWGVSDSEQLAWLDPPPSGHLAGARALLQRLGALDDRQRLTAVGERMAQLPAHPRLARLLLAAEDNGTVALGCDLVALLSERDLAEGGRSRQVSDSDLLDRLELLRRRGHESAARAARYWRDKFAAGVAPAVAESSAAGRLLAIAFPDRIARLREPGSGRYLLSNGTGALLSSRSAVQGAEWLVAVELAGRSGAEGEIRLAHRLEGTLVEELFGAECSWRREVFWDERSGRVAAREVRRLGALLLQQRPVKASSADTVPALLEALHRNGLQLLTWSPAALQLLARARLVATHRSDWPDLSDRALLAAVDDWLLPSLAGINSLAGLKKIDLCPALQGYLGWNRQRELARLTPERIPVPSGSSIRLDYAAEDGPLLACKLQELFGLADTPAVLDGAVPVLIQLLSPAGRPLAVTRDLRSFWNSVYPEVKKEMKGRYPKHPWPDDPWNAVATKLTKKRMEQQNPG